MVLPLIVLGLGASGATMTLVLDLFLRRPFVSATFAGLLPPVALAILLGGGLGGALGLLAFAIGTFVSMPPAFGVAIWRARRSAAPAGVEERENPA